MKLVTFIQNIQMAYVKWLMKNYYGLECCRIASEILGSFLATATTHSVRIDGGSTIFDKIRSTNIVYHVWLIVDNYYIDATISQYTVKQNYDVYMGRSIRHIPYPPLNEIFISKYNDYGYNSIEETDKFPQQYVEAAKQVLDDCRNLTVNLDELFYLYLKRLA